MYLPKHFADLKFNFYTLVVKNNTDLMSDYLLLTTYHHVKYEKKRSSDCNVIESFLHFIFSFDSQFRLTTAERLFSNLISKIE